jgi:hypothetical protein
MKYLVFFGLIFYSLQVNSEPLPVTIPLNQNVAALTYFTADNQTGCGIRITGETHENLAVNILISVFVSEADSPVAMFKLVVKKIIMRNGQPQLKDGKIEFTSIGKIHQAWLKTDSGIELKSYPNGESAHGDGYMTSIPIANAVELLASIPRAKFMVGFGRIDSKPAELLEFNQPITQSEAAKLSLCMKNLSNEMDKKMVRESL